MFIIYRRNHPAGFTANVVQTAANKGVLLAFVAMAQALVVITAGIDLSVGMIFILTNCLASWIVVGTACRDGASACSRVLGAGLALRRAQRRHRHLRPAAADRHDHRHRRDLFRHRAVRCGRSPGGSVNETAGRRR